jgi:hypothetical protein
LETNTLSHVMDESLAAEFRSTPFMVTWDDDALESIVRLRLISDPGFPAWDVSYCWGRLTDGTPVRVSLPFFQLPKRGTNAAIVAEARRAGVFAKRLGIFDAISLSQ